MALLIDGYNLLHACGILGRGIGPGGLERSRNALLNFLAESIAERELSRTTVVFDARDAPPGLPRQLNFRGIRVQFAERGSDADALIEELIASNSAPRRLTVVSSDHRLHRAARRRRATAIDSDRWYAEILRARIERSSAERPVSKPSGVPSAVEVRYWLRVFGLEPEEESPPQGAPPRVSRSERSNAPEATRDDLPLENPFPPGYAEDIGEDDV